MLSDEPATLKSHRNQLIVNYLLIAVTLLFTVRFLSSALINDINYDHFIGECVGVFGIGGRLMQLMAFGAAAMFLAYLLIIRRCDSKGRLQFFAELANYKHHLDSDGHGSFELSIKLTYSLLKTSVNVTPYASAALYMVGNLLAFRKHQTLEYGLKLAAWTLVMFPFARYLAVAWCGIPALGYLVVKFTTMKLNHFNQRWTLAALNTDRTFIDYVIQHIEVVKFIDESNKFLKLILGTANFITGPICAGFVLIMFLYDFGSFMLSMTLAVNASAMLFSSLLIVKSVGKVTTRVMDTYPFLNSVVARKLIVSRPACIQVVFCDFFL